jgi:hypothetical protein
VEDVDRLQFVLPNTGNVSLDVVDTQGRMIRRLADRAFEAGAHTVEWRTQGLKPGVYLVRLRIGQRVEGGLKTIVLGSGSD